MSKAIRPLQMVQLLALTMMHFCVDMFGGMIPVLMPVIRKEFFLSLSHGIWMLALVGLTCNGVQVLIGHWRPDKQRPLLLPIGLFAASSLCLLVFLTGLNSPVVALWMVVLLCGLGIGFVHPEGLRGIYSLKTIPVSLATPIFINAGFFGVGLGGWLAAIVVSAWGLNGLLIFLPLPLGAVVLVFLLRIRLAVDRKNRTLSHSESTGRLSFASVMMMSIPYAISVNILLNLLPTALDELGFEIAFGGYTMMVMVGASVVGSLFWARRCHTHGELWCCTRALLTGVPLLITYLVLMEHKWAVWILAAAACSCMSIFPMLVTMARHAPGANLGGRMGIVIGGSWGMGSLVLIALAPLAEWFGIRMVVNFSCVGFVAMAVTAILLSRRRVPNQ